MWNSTQILMTYRYAQFNMCDFCSFTTQIKWDANVCLFFYLCRPESDDCWYCFVVELKNDYLSGVRFSFGFFCNFVPVSMNFLYFLDFLDLLICQQIPWEDSLNPRENDEVALSAKQTGWLFCSLVSHTTEWTKAECFFCFIAKWIWFFDRLAVQDWPNDSIDDFRALRSLSSDRARELEQFPITCCFDSTCILC